MKTLFALCLMLSLFSSDELASRPKMEPGRIKAEKSPAKKRKIVIKPVVEEESFPVCLVQPGLSIVEIPEEQRQEELARLLEEHEVPFGKEWVQVAVYESGHNLESQLARLTNNPWGMFIPRMRKHLLSPTKRHGPFATYDSLEDAVRDLKLRTEHYKPLENETLYQYLVRTAWNPTKEQYIERLKLVKPRVLVS